MKRNLFTKSLAIVLVAMIISTALMITTSYALDEKFEGFGVAGWIKIEKASIDMPILAESSADAMRKSACLFCSDSGINEAGNTVIIGNNFRDGSLFSNLPKVEKGDSIKITDMNNKTLNYMVYSKLELDPDDTSYLSKEKTGKKEITLVTPTDDFSMRVVISAFEVVETNAEVQNHNVTDSKIITDIDLGTTVKELLEDVVTPKSKKVVDKAGEEIGEDKPLGTGMVITLDGETAYDITVLGDLSGDGKLSSLDVAKLKDYIIGSANLAEKYWRAGDLNGDGKITATDVAKIKMKIIGAEEE